MAASWSSLPTATRHHARRRLAGRSHHGRSPHRTSRPAAPSPRRAAPRPGRSFTSCIPMAARRPRSPTRATASRRSHSLKKANSSAYVPVRATKDERNIPEQNDNADLYLLDVATGKIERLTTNKDIAEGPVSFSPDGRYVAFSAPDDFQFMHLNKVYVRELGNRGGMFRKIGANFDGDVTVGWWSKDAKTIFFNEGIKATEQLCAVDVPSGEVRQLTHEKASMRAAQDPESGRLTITYSDPKTPQTLFTVSSMADIGDRGKWVQLTDANPWVRGSIELGDEEEITWKSRDGRMVGGVLLKPVGYQPGKRYPLIVAIHGGPAGADLLNFNGGYGSQVYAGAGY